MIGTGLIASTCYLVLDVSATQQQRDRNWRARLETTNLPDHALVYGSDPQITAWVFRPGRLAALPISPYPTYDQTLIDRALAEGKLVLVSSAYNTDQLDALYGDRVVNSRYSDNGVAYFEVLPLGAKQ